MKPKQEDPKEMVGGCCVCSDENGWTENPLVYCDGQGCTVAVHQACYGIVTVPTGAWFCRKCESQERAARVHSGGRRIFSQRCELCPSKDGALKRTDSGGWAHVVCALYIPEVRFGNVTTMEPIMLHLIPQDRFNKSCYICEEGGKESRATIGACMQCNKSGCKQHFHVTCAQSMGLLCEEAGNYLDNVKYCGYCQYHFSKLRKGSHVKTIPPYRPVPPEAGASDEDKASGSLDSRDPKLKKKTGRPPGIKPPSNREGKMGDMIGPGSSSGSGSVVVGGSVGGGGGGGGGSSASGTLERHERAPTNEDSNSSTPGSSGLNLGGSVASSIPPNKIDRPSKVSEANIAVSSPLVVTVTSKPMTPVTVSSFSSSSTTSTPPLSSASSSLTTSSFSNSLSSSISLTTLSTSTSSTTVNSLSPTISTIASSLITSIASSVVTTAPVISRPKLSDSLPPTSTPQETPSQISLPHNHLSSPASTPLSTDTDKDSKDKQQDRNRKLRRNGPRTPSGNSNFGDTESIVSNDEAQSSDLVLNICEEKNLSAEKESNKVPSKPMDSSDDGGSLNLQFTQNISNKSTPDPFTPTAADFPTEPAKRGRSASQERGRRSKRGIGKRGRAGVRDLSGHDSGASSPDSFTSEAAPVPKRGRKKAESKDQMSVITNGVGANTLLLGNELNPASAVAQKMTDTLHAELEAHSIYKDDDKALIGPTLPGKKEIQNNASNITATSQPPPFPQSLEQLLERQWEQGSQFLMEQAQHFDIASLLSCLHQLRQENVRLEETVSSLISRRDHLLAVNARLSVPLNSPTPANNSSPAPNPPQTSISSGSSSSSSAGSATHTTHISAPRPSSHGSAPLPPRPHSQGHHPAAGGPPPGGGGGGGHRGASPHDRRGPSPHERRGTSPHDRRVPPPPVPLENGLGEPEYRYRSPGTEHRQQSPMLPPGAQPSPTQLRHSPASGNYHPSVSPHGVGSPSPSGVPHGHSVTSHAPPTHAPPHSMAPSHGPSHGPSGHGPSGHGPSGHGPSGHGPSGQGTGSHGSPHGPPPPPHGPQPPMSVAHNVAISRQSEVHRGDMVRLHSGPPPQHPGPNIGPPGAYSVYQLVSPVPGPHHSPVPPLSQPHPPPPHAQVMRRDLVDSGRGGPGSLEKR